MDKLTIDATVVTSISAVLVALITGALTILGGRKKARADVQVSLNSGFEILVGELQEERAQLIEVAREIEARARAEADALRKECSDLRTECTGLRQQLAALHNERIELRERLVKFERARRKRGED